MLKAVIFDLDGTLTNCDLELAKKTVSAELAALTGARYEDVRKKMDTIHYQFNITSIYDRNVWWEQFDPGLSPQEKQRLTTVYWNCVVETTYVELHAELLLKTLKEKGIILALLTDYDGKSFSKKKRVDLLPLVSYFDLIVIAGDDTEETKPALEPFTFILDRLTLNPDDVLMVGDKPEVDLQGAHTLGMKTLLVEGDYGNQWENTVKDLLSVLDYIESL